MCLNVYFKLKSEMKIKFNRNWVAQISNKLSVTVRNSIGGRMDYYNSTMENIQSKKITLAWTYETKEKTDST